MSEPAPTTSNKPVRRTYLQRVARDALSPFTAKAGLCWIVLLCLMAALAPFIASSHPYAIKTANGWSFPLFKHLTPSDVVLPCSLFSVFAAIFIRRKINFWIGLNFVFWVSTIVYLFSSWAFFTSKSDYAYHQLLITALKPGLSIALMSLLILALAGYAVYAGVKVIPSGLRWKTLAVLAPLCAFLIYMPVNPPKLVMSYSVYREDLAAGKILKIHPALHPYSPNDRMRDLNDQPHEPSLRHPMGIEPNGADVLSRMIHASRIALSIGFIATGIAGVIGIIIGGLMGYFVGWIDLIGMRMIEIFEAIPSLVLLVTITAMYGRNLYLMMAVIGFLSWTGDARFIRAEFFRLRQMDFVQAAKALGLPLRSILFRHMLPNGIAPVLVAASFGVASAILLERHPQLPGPGPGRRALVGPDAQPGAPGQRLYLVDGALPRTSHLFHGFRVQSDRRIAPRRAGSEAK